MMNLTPNGTLSALATIGLEGIITQGYLSSGSVKPLRRNIAIYGDSRTANCSSGALPNKITENYGYASWLGQYSDGRIFFEPAFNFGVGGNTSSQWAARVNTVIAAPADVVVCLISTNDRTADFTLAQTQQNIEATVNKLKEAGKIVIFINETPRGGANALTPARQAIHEQVRAWINSYLPRLGVRVVDVWDSMLNTAAVTVDGLHFNPVGARIVAEALAREIKDLFNTPVPLPRFDSPFDATLNPYGQINTNPLLAGTTGTLVGSSNTTGVVATGYSVSGSSWAGMSVVASKEAAEVGEAQVLKFSGIPTSSGALYTFEQIISLPNAKLAANIKAVADIEFQLEGCLGVSLDFRFLDSGTFNSKCCDRYQDGFPMANVKVDGVQETPTTAITATCTEVKIRVSVYASQNVPMTGYVKIKQLAAIAA
ncbi:lipase [Pseudomonas phage VCM]|uniref:GDSL-like Lipase/Acylhydrolase n=1 Tax=Pseudomonas phage VCM TaxID=1729937 RepID=A0A0S4KWC4_9CAUD|nr:lipase [Pseudomonas phage VCM]CUR44335.1 GDSL-like Lipase/Acylhydrolase [Pseudomonas phage VCM]